MSTEVKVTLFTKEVLAKILAAGEKGLQQFLERSVHDAKKEAPVRGAYRSKWSAEEMHRHSPGITGGTLRDSITYEIEKKGNNIEGRLYTQCGYGAWVEIGTSQMEPRPFIKPAVEKNIDRIAKDIKENMPND